jgi:hypothetical protein
MMAAPKDVDPYLLPEYCSHLVLQNTSNSGSPSRQSKAIFSPNGFTPMGGMEQKHKTRKGNTARRLFAVLNTPPTSFKTGQISNRSMHA